MSKYYNNIYASTCSTLSVIR